jgi:hypothetical protein
MILPSEKSEKIKIENVQKIKQNQAEPCTLIVAASDSRISKAGILRAWSVGNGT